MSVLSRVATPAATHDLADVVVTLFSNSERAAPRDLPGSVGDQLPGNENQLAVPVVGRFVTGPTELGTSAAHIPWRCTALGETIAATGRGVGLNIWAWRGDNREWHSTTERYHGARKSVP